MLRAAMGFLYKNATEMVTEEQAQCLHALEQLNSMSTATRACVLGSFISGQGYAADADYSPRSWLIHRTRITKGAATAHTAWARRAAAHPLVVAALAEGDALSESYGRKLCEWTDKLPEDCRAAADAILVAAARAGVTQQDLVELAMEIYARSLPASPDDQPDDGFEDRQVRVETTLGGAGVVTGDLTPECVTVVTAVLDALSAPADAEDSRTHGQRYHDALQEAMKRLLASGLLPERAGQPVKAWVHVSLAELRALDDGSALEREWIAEVRVQWAAHRAAASEGAGDGAAWLDGDAARAATCDATLTPVVTGNVEVRVLDDLVRLCLHLTGHGPHCTPQPVPDRAPGPSPDRECEVHHVKHKANGGPTSLKECVLLCTYHHQIVIHRWGWTLVLNPDGTTSAWNPDRTKVLHSHGPPARPG
jgi:Domain of unknown function (DUF222)